jgi:hypothetical protein
MGGQMLSGITTPSNKRKKWRKEIALFPVRRLGLTLWQQVEFLVLA